MKTRRKKKDEKIERRQRKSHKKSEIKVKIKRRNYLGSSKK
jgi:hypothetical protein